MKNGREHRVMMCGTGGQGILMIGWLLTEAGMSRYRHATYFPNYFAAMRGGVSEVTVTLSDNEIGSQAVYNPEAVIIFHPMFFKDLEKRMQSGGIFFVDSSMAPMKLEREDLTPYYFPATQKALEIGNIQVANLIMLGAYLEGTRVLSIEAVELLLEKKLAGGRMEELLEIDRKALKEGAKLMKEYN